jgi:hypothetical protein
MAEGVCRVRIVHTSSLLSLLSSPCADVYIYNNIDRVRDVIVPVESCRRVIGGIHVVIENCICPGSARVQSSAPRCAE